MTYSLDLRKKALEYLENGGSQKSACSIFGVSLRTLGIWISRQKKNKLAASIRPKGSYKINEQELKEYIRKYPDAYLREIAEHFSTTLQAIFYACKRLKITLKKRSPSTKKETKKKDNSSYMN